MPGMEATIRLVADLTDAEQRDIVSSLTRPGSEFRAECVERKSNTPVSIVRHAGGRIVAWAATHRWNGLQTLEGFTSESHRRQGLGRTAACLLITAGIVDRSEDVAVFAPEYASLAKSIGFRSVRVFARDGQNWKEQ